MAQVIGFIAILGGRVLAIGAVLAGLPVVLSRGTELQDRILSPYECGFDPIGANRLAFSLQFFSVAILFLVFDVEICLLFPAIVLFAPRRLPR